MIVCYFKNICTPCFFSVYMNETKEKSQLQDFDMHVHWWAVLVDLRMMCIREIMKCAWTHYHRTLAEMTG